MFRNYIIITEVSINIEWNGIVIIGIIGEPYLGYKKTDGPVQAGSTRSWYAQRHVQCKGNKYLNKPLYFSRYRDFFQIWYTDLICHVCEIKFIMIIREHFNISSWPCTFINVNIKTCFIFKKSDITPSLCQQHVCKDVYIWKSHTNKAACR